MLVSADASHRRRWPPSAWRELAVAALPPDETVRSVLSRKLRAWRTLGPNAGPCLTTARFAMAGNPLQGGITIKPCSVIYYSLTLRTASIKARSWTQLQMHLAALGSLSSSTKSSLTAAGAQRSGFNEQA